LKAKTKFAELTEDDLLFDEGKKTKCGETTTKLGKTEKKLNHYLTNFSLFNKRKLFHEKLYLF
jgi:hypothetical protein